MCRMDSLITVRTELFNYREVKPHFINQCCFGEDFALWLKDKVAPLEASDSSFRILFKRTTDGVSGPGTEMILFGSLFPV